MKWILDIKSHKTGKIKRLTTFSPSNVGDIIGWGEDEAETDGIERWTVLNCRRENVNNI